MRRFLVASCLLAVLFATLPLASAEVKVKIERPLPIPPLHIKEKVREIPMEAAISEPGFKYRIIFGKTIYDDRDEYYGIYLHAYRPNSSGIAFIYVAPAEEKLTIESIELCFPWGCYRSYDVPRDLEAREEVMFTIEFETFESSPFHPVLKAIYSNYTGSYSFCESTDETLCVYSEVQAEAVEKIQEAAFLIGVKYVLGGIFRPEFTTGEGKEFSYKAFQKLTEAIMSYKRGDFETAKEAAGESLNLIEIAIMAEKRGDEIKISEATSSLIYSIGITIGLLSIGAGLILIGLMRKF
ncbi:MAG: hypothetical protein ACXQTS_04075 [Candidatus Methanospirareceae archaeon]